MCHTRRVYLFCLVALSFRNFPVNIHVGIYFSILVFSIGLASVRAYERLHLRVALRILSNDFS